MGTDSNFQSDIESRKSTSGYVFTLGGGAVSWRGVKQSSIADSTMEAEYIAVLEAANEAVWLKNFLLDLGVVPSAQSAITLYCDNSEAKCKGTQEPQERKYHLIREIVGRGDIVVSQIASENKRLYAGLP